MSTSENISDVDAGPKIGRSACALVSRNEQALVHEICKYWQQFKCAPSLRDLATAMDVSLAWVRKLLENVIRKDLVLSDARVGTARTIRPTAPVYMKFLKSHRSRRCALCDRH